MAHDAWDEKVGPPGNRMKLSSWYRLIQSNRKKEAGSPNHVAAGREAQVPAEAYQKIQALLDKQAAQEPLQSPLTTDKRPMQASGVKDKARKDRDVRISPELKAVDLEDRPAVERRAAERKAAHNEAATRFAQRSVDGGRQPKQAAIDYVLHHAGDGKSKAAVGKAGTFQRFGITFDGKDEAEQYRDLQDAVLRRVRQLKSTHGLPEGLSEADVAQAILVGQAKPEVLQKRGAELDEQAAQAAAAAKEKSEAIDKLRTSYTKVLPTRWGYLEKQKLPRLYQAYEAAVKKSDELGIKNANNVERLAKLKTDLGRGASKDVLIAAILEREVAIKKIQDAEDEKRELAKSRIRGLRDKEAEGQKVLEGVPNARRVKSSPEVVVAGAVGSAQQAIDNFSQKYSQGKQAWLDLKALIIPSNGVYGRGTTTRSKAGIKLREAFKGTTFLGRMILKTPAVIPILLAVSIFCSIAGFAFMVAASEDTGDGILQYGGHAWVSTGAVFWNALLIVINGVIAGATAIIKITLGFWLTLANGIYGVLFSPLIDGVNTLAEHVGVEGAVASWEINPHAVKGDTLLHISYIEPATLSECEGPLIMGTYRTIPVGEDDSVCPPYVVYNKLFSEANQPITVTAGSQKFSLRTAVEAWGETWTFVLKQAVRTGGLT